MVLHINNPQVYYTSSGSRGGARPPWAPQYAHGILVIGIVQDSLEWWKVAHVDRLCSWNDEFITRKMHII